MLNNNIEKNKISIIRAEGAENLSILEIKNIIAPLNNERKRDWFTSHFYKCLPLSIGNMQGFVVKIPYEFDVFWNGGSNQEDLFLKFYDKNKKTELVTVSSHFGFGILTINLPFIIKTDNDINIMTTSPPNFPTPGLSPLCGVVETDNLKYTFSLNIKVDIPNVWIKILPNSPLVGLLPIPRFFCDQFEIIDGDVELNQDFVKNEKEIAKEHGIVRNFLSNISNDSHSKLDRTYFLGTDIRGNKFNNHQLPKKIGINK